jgi:hypothetical protein
MNLDGCRDDPFRNVFVKHRIVPPCPPCPLWWRE